MKKLSSITQATKGELFGKDLISASEIVNTITIDINSSDEIDYIVVKVDGNVAGTIKT